jgi:hypothetical protein
MQKFVTRIAGTPYFDPRIIVGRAIRATFWFAKENRKKAELFLGLSVANAAEQNAYCPDPSEL